MAKYPDFRSAAIPALHAVQRYHGWCSPTAIEQAACVMRLTPAYLTAVATFYDMFVTVPQGEHTIYVCTNISCSLRGADAIYEAMQDAAGADARFNVRGFECLGACDIAPMASVNGEYVGPLDRGRLPHDRRRPDRRPPAAAGQEPRGAPVRRDAGDPRVKLFYEDIDTPGPQHARRVREDAAATRCSRKALKMEPDAVLAELQASDVRGRGGAGFAMGKKASFLPNGTMDKYLVCNADESEPGTFKDRELMQKNPHLLIEGMIIARLRGGHQPLVHLHPRRVRAPGRRARRGGRGGARGRLPRRAHPRLRPHARPGRAPRRRRLHLRRGDRAARLARGQARQPAPEAAVPRAAGPLPGPDADQQRRDADERPDHHADGRRASTRRSAPRPRPAPRSSRSRAACAGPGNYEIALGIPSREIIWASPAVPRRAARSRPGSPAARARRCSPAPTSTSTCPTTSTRWRRPARCSARARSSSSTTRSRSSTSRYKTAKFYRHESCGKCTPCREGTNWTVKMLERIENGDATPMDLDIMASVQEQIIGNCLCVLGDAMAMPIGSMIKHFREEFEAHIEMRARAERPRRGDPAGQPRPQRRPGPDARPRRRRPDRGGRLMPRPRRATSRSRSTGGRSPRPRTRCWSTPPSTATSRSRSSATSPSSASRSAPAACAWSRSRASRSCRPPARRRSRTAWSSTPRPTACTTRSARSSSSCSSTTRSTARSATRAASARCRTSPTAGAPARSRFIEPKRHFKKPLELSPLVAIDRERCILCYRCVRFSQEISEDYQLILLERGAHSFVGTFDGHPYVAPFSGNIVELCPVGALTSSAYRFRARPWDIEGAGSLCTLCPAQCNVEFTVRDDRVMRVLARDNPDVDDGWLCDKGRFGYQSIHVDERITKPLVREGTNLMPASWEKALSARRQRAQEGGRRGRPRWPAARPPTRRRSCSRGCSATGSARATSPRAPAASCRSTSSARSPTPRCRRRCPTSSSPTRSLLLDCDPVDDAPILDLRIRKGVRRHHVQVASPAAPTRSTRARRRCARARRGEAFRRARRRARRRRGNLGGAAAPPASTRRVRALATRSRDAGEDIVIVYGERLSRPAARRRGAAQPRRPARARRPRRRRAARDPLVDERARPARGRASPPATARASRRSPSPAATPRRSPPALADGDLRALARCTPTRCARTRTARLWKSALDDRADRDRGTTPCSPRRVREFADVVFPAEAYAEKEGTVTHPDGRVQRLRAGDRAPAAAGGCGPACAAAGRSSPTSPRARARPRAC